MKYVQILPESFLRQDFYLPMSRHRALQDYIAERAGFLISC